MNLFTKKKIIFMSLSLIVLCYCAFIMIIAGLGVYVKDNVTFGENINLEESQLENFVAFGENIRVNSLLGENAVLGGEDVVVDDVVEGNLVAVGQNVTIAENAEIKGNTFVASENLVIEGSLNDKAYLAGEDVLISGNVENIDIEAEKVVITGNIEGKLRVKAKKLEIAETASISSLVYDVSDLNISDKASIAEKREDELNDFFDDADTRFSKLSELEEEFSFGELVFDLVLTLIAFYLFKDLFAKSKDMIQEKPTKVLQKGLLIEFGIIALIVISFVTIVGIPLAILLIIGNWLLWKLALVAAICMLALFLNSKIPKENQSKLEFVILLVSFFGMYILLNFGATSGLLSFISAILAIGAVYLVKNQKEVKGEEAEKEIK